MIKSSELRIGNYVEYNGRVTILIKYVHQLQNLYVTLTGEELILNNKNLLNNKP